MDMDNHLVYNSDSLFKILYIHIKILILHYKHAVMLRIPLIALFICLCTSICFAQDSIKKLKPVNSVSKYTTYKYHSNKRHSDSLNTAALKPDTSKAPVVVDKSLYGQYQTLTTKIYRFQQPFAYSLWKNFSDTLKLSPKRPKDCPG